MCSYNNKSVTNNLTFIIIIEVKLTIYEKNCIAKHSLPFNGFIKIQLFNVLTMNILQYILTFTGNLLLFCFKTNFGAI